METEVLLSSLQEPLTNPHVIIRIQKTREPSADSGKSGNQLTFIKTQKLKYLTHV
jgi:hypothetical protein